MTDWCVCGHARAEHDRVYDWSKGSPRCSGFVVAFDREGEGEPSSSRPASCECAGFSPAGDHRIAEWESAGQLPG